MSCARATTAAPQRRMPLLLRKPIAGCAMYPVVGLRQQEKNCEMDMSKNDSLAKYELSNAQEHIVGSLSLRCSFVVLFSLNSGQPPTTLNPSHLRSRVGRSFKASLHSTAFTIVMLRMFFAVRICSAD